MEFSLVKFPTLIKKSRKREITEGINYQTKKESEHLEKKKKNDYKYLGILVADTIKKHDDEREQKMRKEYFIWSRKFL